MVIAYFPIFYLFVLRLLTTNIKLYVFGNYCNPRCKISHFTIVISGNYNDYFQILTFILIPGISLSCLTALLHTTLYCDETVSTL